ncbi:MAG TPA: hypothetical protein VFZ15_01630 [Acidimicrobiia bacterium]|nr:hypothetical protein [Acidimicrobiia bacterium]
MKANRLPRLADEDGGIMSSFSARLRLPGRSRLPLGVEVDIHHERLTLTAGDREVGAWPLEKLEVASQPDGFYIKIDGDLLVLDVADPNRFAAEMGIDREPPKRLSVVETTQPTQTELAPANADQDGNNLETNGNVIIETVRAEDVIDDIERRISDIATALGSDSVSPAAALSGWLKLLKEINRLHGEESMPTHQYYRLNTRLLDLIPEPDPVLD